MRLSFPNGEMADVLAPPGEVRIGSASTNTVVLNVDGIRPHHATILTDSRGITLMVDDPEAAAYVNARPIKERALLRLGDVVSLQSVNLILKPDRDDAVRTPPDSAFTEADGADGADTGRGGPPRVVLRGVAGPYFGRAIPIPERLILGSGKDCNLVLDESELAPRHAEIRVRPGVGIFMRDLGSKQGTAVNGLQVKDAVLFTGDQISFQQNRFVLEAPGMPTRKDQATVGTGAAVVSAKPGAAENRAPGPQQVTQTMKAIRPDQIAEAESKQKAAAAQKKTAEQPLAPAAKQQGSSPWLLIAIGVMIAVGIALLLMARSAG